MRLLNEERKVRPENEVSVDEAKREIKYYCSAAVVAKCRSFFIFNNNLDTQKVCQQQQLTNEMSF